MLKRILTILIIGAAVVLVLLLSMPSDGASEGPSAAQGRLNAASWDIVQTPVIPLDGEWEFYWNRLLTPEDFEKDAPVPDGYMQVPSLWNGKTINGERLPAFGCATYRLVVENIPPQERLALKKVNVRFSCRIYVNGRELLADGMPAVSAAGYQSGNTPQLGLLESADGTFEIIVQAANYEYLNAGIPASLELGQAEVLLKQQQQKHLTALMVFAILFTLALLHLIFFLMTRNGVLRNPMLLLFSLFCIQSALGNGLTEERSLLLFFPQFSFTWVFKLKDFFLSSNFIIILWIIYRFQNGMIMLRLIRILSLAYGAYLLAILLLPIHVYSKIQGLVILCNTLVLLVSLIRSIYLYLKGTGSILLFAALLDVSLYTTDFMLFAMGAKESSAFEQVYVLLFAMVMIGFLAAEYRDTVSRLRFTMQQAADAEIAFLRAQIRPHFLYNTLGVIAAQITQEPQKAKTLLYDLTDYLRGSFHFKAKDGKIPLIEEINTVKAYLSIEQARFGDLLRVEYDIEENLNAMVPLLCIQPVVENAVRHGIFKRMEGGRVLLQIRRENNLVVIRVEDDGVGIPKELLERIRHGESGGVGLKNIQRRLDSGRGLGLNIESAEDIGTTVTIKMIYEEVPDEDYFSGR